MGRAGQDGNIQFLCASYRKKRDAGVDGGGKNFILAVFTLITLIYLNSLALRLHWKGGLKGWRAG